MAKMIPSDDVASVTHPFIGLRAFSYRDRRFFFGREQQLEVLVPLSSGSRFVTIVGSSGSGKSSLVRAGLLPRLESSEHGFIWIECRPREAPIRELAQAICSIGGTKGDYSEALTDRLELLLQKSSFGIREAMSFIELERSAKLLILVDQFEEIFRFADLRLREEVNAAFAAETRDEAAAFVRLLLTAAQISEYEIHIAITMRSDFIGDCARFHGLPEAVSGTQFLVPSLTRDQLEDVIRRPIEQAGAAIEPELVERLLNDCSTELDQLPVLQHCLLRLWEEAGRAGAAPGAGADAPARRLTTEHYRKIGSFAGALSQHADELLQDLPGPTLQLAVEQTFRALSELDKEGRATRRPVRFAQLHAETGAAEPDLRRALDRFRADDCSFLVPPHSDVPALEATTRIDVGHEALLRRWEKVSGQGAEPGWLRAEQQA